MLLDITIGLIMEDFIVKSNQLTVAAYQALRGTTSWEKLPDTQVREALSKDLHSVTVFKDDGPVGMGRVVGDGSIYFYVQDVIVHPNHQGCGIGKLIMESIEGYFEQSITGYAFIGLMSAQGVQEFYRKLGYQARPDGAPGMYKVFNKN